MNNPGRGVAFGLGVVLIVMVGLAVAMSLAPSSPPASSEPSPTISAAATTAPPSESPSAQASASPSASQGEPSASASPSSPEPSATGTAGVTATIRGLTLDGRDDPAGHDRRISFRTEGPADVSMRLVVSPPNAVDACLEVNAVQLYCTSGHAFTMTGETSRSNATWTLTLRGQHAETPKLDVALEFPAAEPTVTIEGAWFDGAARPDYNGVVFEISPREPAVSISATWDGSQPYRLTITEPSGSGVQEFEGTNSTVTESVQLGLVLQRIELVNTGAGAVRVPLTATIAWR